jgi:hypothetical protein
LLPGVGKFLLPVFGKGDPATGVNVPAEGSNQRALTAGPASLWSIGEGEGTVARSGCNGPIELDSAQVCGEERVREVRYQELPVALDEERASMRHA